MSNNTINRKINKLKSELLQLAKKTKNINSEKMVNKSQELDELIILYMEKKNLAG